MWHGTGCKAVVALVLVPAREVACMCVHHSQETLPAPDASACACASTHHSQLTPSLWLQLFAADEAKLRAIRDSYRTV